MMAATEAPASAAGLVKAEDASELIVHRLPGRRQHLQTI
jgi:hypothetical protein